MNAFVLKIIAIVAMTFDHIGAEFLPFGLGYEPYAMIFRIVGRLTMPIMCFFIGEGFTKTRNRGKYAVRLAVFAVISEIPYRMFFGDGMNVMFTLLLGFCALWASDYLKNLMHTDSFRIPVYLFTATFSMIIGSDWDYIGILLIIAFYHGRESRVKAVLYPLGVYVFVLGASYIDALTVSGFQHFYINYIQFSGCLSIPLIMLYNGKKGPSAKYLFYLYYPLHLLLLWAISTFGVNSL